MRYALCFLAMLFLSYNQRADLAPAIAPPCVQELIHKNTQLIGGAGLTEVYRYKYQNRYVFLGISGCCDRLNYLIDQSCTVLCAPSGGFTSGGDFTCSSFFKEATEKTLLWKRPK